MSAGCSATPSPAGCRLAGLAVVLLTLGPALGLATSPPGSDGRLTDIRPERQLWGTVLEMPSASQLVLRTPELARLQVRLLGVEPPVAPRPRSAAAAQPYGEEAQTYARGLLLDKQVLVEPHGRDRQGRLLAVVFLGEIDVNLMLVREGLAWVSPRVDDAAVRARLEVAQRQAQVAGYGLWSLSAPEPPWEFRRRHRLAAE